MKKEDLSKMETIISKEELRKLIDTMHEDQLIVVEFCLSDEEDDPNEYPG